MEKINNIIMENPTVTLLNIVMLIFYTMAISKLNERIENSKNEGIFIFMGIILTIIYGLTVYVSIQEIIK
ncbi:hypothetical protein [Campylobacter ureolyticus]|uniref:hypothetical protein n=1 Tax=Campylobacter ureolyticus TaxID=827 RepID=UPI0029082D46|nr:hypothetical protein [Campylobacter ureolyticus]MDU7071290.1 hypothetical protein [Campylobacter ureolyticus]